MPKRVGVQDDLIDISRELEERGYTITSMDGEDLEAIVYLNHDGDIPYLSNAINMNMGFDVTFNKGTILINAQGRTVDEIENIIKNRIYSPLFK